MEQEDKFLSVLESNKGILFKVASSYCTDSEDKKDLIQEIIYQLWKSFEKYDPSYKYSTWIYRISLNVAISFYRKKRTATSSTIPLLDSVFNIKEMEPNTEKEARLNLLQQFITELKDLDKALMVLYLEEKSYKEIAEIMGISATNVATKISRIKTLLKVKFNH